MREFVAVAHTMSTKNTIDRIESSFLAGVENANWFVEHVKSTATSLPRLLSITLREIDQLDAYPVLPSDMSPLKLDHPTTKRDAWKLPGAVMITARAGFNSGGQSLLTKRLTL